MSFNGDVGTYFGSMYVGTPLQGDASNMIAYDTSIVWTLVPSSDCAGCPNKWFTESESTTFDDTDAEKHNLDKNLWVGTSKNVTDTVCLELTNSSTCATDLEFGLLTFEVEPPYDYAGALGLGLPESDYKTAANGSSFVEVWAVE